MESGVETRARSALAFLRQEHNAWIPDRDETIDLISQAIDLGRLQMLGGGEQRVGLAAQQANHVDDVPVISDLFTLRCVLMFMTFQEQIGRMVMVLRWRNVLFTIGDDGLRATHLS